MVPGDLIPIVDVNATTSPTGETKAVALTDLGVYIASAGLIAPPFQSWQYANGLFFDETVAAPGAALVNVPYGKFPNLGSGSFSLVTRVMVPSTFTGAHTQSLFGVTGNNVASAWGATSSAYIGIAGDSLIGFVSDTFNSSSVIIPGFFKTYYDRTVQLILSKTAGGSLSFFVNGTLIPSASFGVNTTGSIGNTTVMMNTGINTSGFVKCTIYEGQIYNKVFDTTSSLQLFYGGPNLSDPNLVSSYISSTLNPGNTQWLDNKSNNHILLPVSGANATNPHKRFSLRFYLPNPGQPNVSDYLGVGGQTFKDVLPPNYVLTSCFLSSPGKPLLSLGTSNLVSAISSSGTGSWNDNRVPLSSASFGLSNLELLSTGLAHPSRSIYVFFASSSAAPCTFSFEGYIRD